MTPEITEMGAMMDAASRYLEGQCSIQELNGYAKQCATGAHFRGLHPAIKDTAEHWVSMIYRRWNEWNDVKNPLSEQEFRAWLQEQLLP